MQLATSEIKDTQYNEHECAIVDTSPTNATNYKGIHNYSLNLWPLAMLQHVGIKIKITTGARACCFFYSAYGIFILFGCA